MKLVPHVEIKLRCACDGDPVFGNGVEALQFIGHRFVPHKEMIEMFRRDVPPGGEVVEGKDVRGDRDLKGVHGPKQRPLPVNDVAGG